MQQAGQALQQAQQQLAQAGQQGGQDGQQGPGGGQAMAGKDGYGADGMPGGQGQGKGQGSAKMGTGMANAGPDAGHGTTNQRQEGGPMGENPPKNRQAKERPATRSQFERIYAPERIASNRIDTRVTGKQGKGQRPSDYELVRGAPDRSSASQPYYEVYSSYRHAAEEALDKEDVPVTYKKQVRDYFDSLRP